MSESTNMVNRITGVSDRRRFYFSEGDFSRAAVCVTPSSESFNLVIRMACCVIVSSCMGRRNWQPREDEFERVGEMNGKGEKEGKE